MTFEQLVEGANQYLIQKQADVMEEYELGTYDKWTYDALIGELYFWRGEEKHLKISCQTVGSYLPAENTWLWSWADSSVPDDICNLIDEEVKSYGLENEFEKLIEPEWGAEEIDCWEMVAIAVYLLDAKGAYRCVMNEGKSLSFFVFMDIEFVE